GDGRGHHEDGATGDEEAHVYGDTEAENPWTVAPQCGTALPPGHPARFERTGREFEGEQPPREEDAENRGENRSDGGHEPEEREQQAGEDRARDEPEGVEGRAPEARFGARNELAEVGFDDPPD